MIKAVARLEGFGVYQQSKEYASYVGRIKSEKGTGADKHRAFEERTWRNRAHTNKDGHMIIPDVQFKKCLIEGAVYSGERKGGKSTGPAIWRFFAAGVQVANDLVLPQRTNTVLNSYEGEDEIEGRWVFGSSNGKPGGPRVWKCFPTIVKWEGDVEFLILDDETITEDLFERVLAKAGKFVGVGTHRPAKGGDHGRFKIVNLDWLEED